MCGRICCVAAARQLYSRIDRERQTLDMLADERKAIAQALDAHTSQVQSTAGKRWGPLRGHHKNGFHNTGCTAEVELMYSLHTRHAEMMRGLGY